MEALRARCESGFRRTVIVRWYLAAGGGGSGVSSMGSGSAWAMSTLCLAGRSSLREACVAERSLVAGGERPGRGWWSEHLKEKQDVDGISAPDFAGRLIRRCGLAISSYRAKSKCGHERPFVQGDVVSVDRVAVTAAEKRDLRTAPARQWSIWNRRRSQRKAREWDVPFCCVRAVSDVAGDDLPLDFNRYRDADGRFRANADRAGRHGAALHGVATIDCAGPELPQGRRTLRRVSCRLPILASPRLRR